MTRSRGVALPAARGAAGLLLCASAACLAPAPLTPLPPPRPAGAIVAIGSGAAPGRSPGVSARRSPRERLASLSDEEYLRARALLVPVAGVSPRAVPDSYRARRGARMHAAVDILAPRGTPVVAADSGAVLKLARNRAGGVVIYAIDATERLVHYYAHLERYRPELREGQRLARGDTIGYVGTTGNAPAGTPHLHFQVMRRDPGKGYWEGTPLDARPYFTSEAAR